MNFLWFFIKFFFQEIIINNAPFLVEPTSCNRGSEKVTRCSLSINVFVVNKPMIDALSINSISKSITFIFHGQMQDLLNALVYRAVGTFSKLVRPENCMNIQEL